MVQVRWGDTGIESVPPDMRIQKFVECLEWFKPRIAESSETRIVLEPYNGRFKGKSLIIFECSGNEMYSLARIAEWYVQANHNLVFTTIKSPTEYSAGISQAQLCAN